MASSKAKKTTKANPSCGRTVENFSTLSARLQTAEKAGINSTLAGLSVARHAVVEAASQFHASRYTLGMALHRYKSFFVEDHCWLKAANVIARTLDCDERTIRNTVADYQRVAALPTPVIDAALAEGVDLAKQKHSALAEALTEKFKNKPAPTKTEAKALISKEVSKLRSAKQQTALPKVTLDKADKLRWQVREGIRSAVMNIPRDEKQNELFAAIEEWMYHELGSREPVTHTFTPKPGKLDIDGKPVKKTVVNAAKADKEDKAVAA